ncbi:flagellar hook protein FlgE [Candidatus Magnetaquicoccus inordinatus]|uniref:flagellar hook protein FlgE n=1 Tax=Candidatus Magnetaquicoccus inordinatus TaxID=2496818 RepID=UPI00187D4522|nr:flagellar hook protein FlgE [Candidatus Magnetaquicoccus inordinatus]
MSITQAMYAGASALTNFSESITVIGNNLANSNTTAFKSSQASFEDVLIQTVGNSGAGNANQVGTGMGLAAVQQNMVQGSFAPTVNVTDLSIDGRGFFTVKDLKASGKTDSTGTPVDTFYTRAGNFRQNEQGYLVTPGGMVLQGKEIGSSMAPIDINLKPYERDAGLATTRVNVGVNLDTSATVFDPAANFDPEDSATYNFSTSVRVYDSLGAGHNLEIQFRKIGDSQWQWQAAVQASEVTSGATGMQVLSFGSVPASGTAPTTPYTPGLLEFDDHGRLLREGSSPMAVHFLGGTSQQDILVDFGQAVGAGGDSSNDYALKEDTDLSFDSTLTAWNTDVTTSSSSGSTSVFGGFATTKLDQNGFPRGNLDKISISGDGVITGNYTNSRSKALCQITLADFDDETALAQKGSNLFAATTASGAAHTNVPEGDRLGSIVSYSLEQSNVDMSGEFVRMIATQRGFQANSRIVSVVDGMLEELLSLKR